MDDPRARERQLRQGWDNLSEELKKDYGEEYLEKSTLSFEFLKCRELVIIVIINQNYYYLLIPIGPMRTLEARLINHACNKISSLVIPLATALNLARITNSWGSSL